MATQERMAQEQTVLLVQILETEPPAGEEAVHWLLLTSLPVQTVEQALTVVRWLYPAY